MRLVRTLLPEGKTDSALAILEDMDVDYVTSSISSPENYCLVEFPVPVGVVDDILDQFQDLGIDVGRYTVVTSIETATTHHSVELEDRYVEDASGIRRISHAELRADAQELQSDILTFGILSTLSAMVAAAGLLLDSAIVITGSMVLAPFLGAIVAASVGLTIDDRELIVDSLVYQPLGFGLAMLGGGIAGVLFKWGNVVPSLLDLRSLDQLASFSTPSALIVTISIIAGVAVALTVVADISSAFAGIAVAAALVPSAATIGIGLVWNAPSIAFGALVLLLINVAAINIFAYGTFFLLGYRSRTLRRLEPDLTPSLHTTGVLVLAVFAVVVVGFTVLASYNYITFHQTVNSEVEDVLSRPGYEDLSFVQVRAENDVGFSGNGITVTVVVSSSTERRYPGLAEALAREIAPHVAQEVTVRVRTVEYQTSTYGMRAPRISVSPRPGVRLGGARTVRRSLEAFGTAAATSRAPTPCHPIWSERQTARKSYRSIEGAPVEWRSRPHSP